MWFFMNTYFLSIQKTDNCLSLPVPTRYNHNFDDFFTSLTISHSFTLHGNSTTNTNILFATTVSTNFNQTDVPVNDISDDLRRCSRPRKTPIYLKDFPTNNIVPYPLQTI